MVQPFFIEIHFAKTNRLSKNQSIKTKRLSYLWFKNYENITNMLLLYDRNVYKRSWIKH